ncbi:hypothetical protein [Chryseobacterium polytrichastri]|uniref:Uncharacterized protein n=1 Tax=Chryseobacterium polytrichastri TaxID=1302687 RepID=A0A1M7CL47_9FLAO|nr:hypothetical protein [Chryseobacterium polytrichastri]SHL67998.1 hypothetical protein SAMN05444267_102264 [Chryseobacterium polytrichastri]
MKYIKTISVALLFLSVSQIDAQKKTTADTAKKEATQQKPVDNPTKCSNIKEGTFLRINYPKNLWYMTVKDNVQTEYYNDGKDHIKSSLVFVDDCNYKLIVLEKTEEANRIKVGDVFSNKVIATQDNYIKIQSKIDNEQFDLVLIKAKTK